MNECLKLNESWKVNESWTVNESWIVNEVEQWIKFNGEWNMNS